MSVREFVFRFPMKSKNVGFRRIGFAGLVGFALCSAAPSVV